MEENLTEKIKEWLYADKDKHELAEGAMLLLRISGNRILYQNIMRNPAKYEQVLVYQLNKLLKFRLAKITHNEVAKMEEKVQSIAEKKLSLTTENPAADWKKGKRMDHDKLPEEIQALYAENLSIVQKMRELHLKLRSLSTQNLTCPDSERYPFLKEIIELDKKLHSNWEVYDKYTEADGQAILDEYQRKSELKTIRKINMAKGRYKRNPNDKLKQQIIELYNSLKYPAPTIKAELIQLNIL